MNLILQHQLHKLENKLWCELVKTHFGFGFMSLSILQHLQNFVPTNVLKKKVCSNEIKWIVSVTMTLSKTTNNLSRKDPCSVGHTLCKPGYLSPLCNLVYFAHPFQDGQMPNVKLVSPQNYFLIF